MGWVDDLPGPLVGLDTAPLIFYIEEHPVYLPIVDPLFRAAADGRLMLVTSMITLIEVLTHPMRHGHDALAEQYRNILLAARGLRIEPVSAVVAEQAASLRATHGLRTPDAVQVATALCAGAGVFVTNDARLSELPELQVIVLDRLRSPQP